MASLVLTDSSQLTFDSQHLEVLKARYVFALMGFLGASILYFVRVNISVAIVAMVNHTALASERTTVEISSEDVCPGGETNATSAKSEDGEFKWDEELQGIILSGFFYGYAAGQLLGGQLAERFGGKIVYGLGTFIAAALTVVSPQCAWISDKLLFAVRLLEGLAEVRHLKTSGYLGTITCFPISGLLCDWGVAGGWPMVFYVFGGLGVVWFIPWLFLVYDTPQQHPRISKEERDYIQTSIGTVPTKKALATPWKELLLSPGLWACAVMYMGIGWTFFTLLTGLPTYMKHVLHFNIKSNALLSTIPYITGGVFSVILGYLMDYIIAEGCVTKLTASSIGPAVTLLLITVIGCNPVWIIVLLAINGLCMGTQYTGNSMNLIALAPNFAGTTYGLCNTFSSSVGILAPYVTGFLTKNNQTRTQWNLVFYTSAAVSVITFIFYMALCTDEEQPWNNPHPDIDFFKVRYVFWCLGMLGMAILYALRGNLSIAIVAMVNHTAISQYNQSAEFTSSAREEPCDWVDEEMQDAESRPPVSWCVVDPFDLFPRLGHQTHVELLRTLVTFIQLRRPVQEYESGQPEHFWIPLLERLVADGELNWDSTYQAFILSGFFYGYLVGQIPGGILTERFQGKLVFGLGLLATAILTIVSPFTLWVSGELFFVTRLLEGLAETRDRPSGEVNHQITFYIVISSDVLDTATHVLSMASNIQQPCVFLTHKLVDLEFHQPGRSIGRTVLVHQQDEAI
uniref:Inorganic phosphate cotransporter n=1 Tax=Timema monikensis TaxID=170555 RepID=A0A7R9HNP2_9NEOP|nr:unnamed protein product [Timema monikensis]